MKKRKNFYLSVRERSAVLDLINSIYYRCFVYDGVVRCHDVFIDCDIATILFELRIKFLQDLQKNE